MASMVCALGATCQRAGLSTLPGGRVSRMEHRPGLRRSTACILALLLALLAGRTCADEGMWTFDQFPANVVRAKYGVQITPAWLAGVQASTLRLANCTASFVSPTGLILTNHHCVEGCLSEHSSPTRDLMRDGFLARTHEEELRCSTQTADVLVGMENITAEVAQAIQGLSAVAADKARKAVLSRLESRCEHDSRENGAGIPLKCESVTLYDGGLYYLYEYRRYSDVRLVFTPENDIAAFGGDVDNFQFPRWDLDMALLRAYVGPDKPAQTPNHFTIDFAGPHEGELVFVAGNPGSTQRSLTVSQLETLRDVNLPRWLLRASELRGRYIQFGKTSAEAARIVEEPLTGLENAIKVRRGMLDALLDEQLMAHKRAAEAALRAKIESNPSLAASVDDAWSQIDRAQQAARELYPVYTFVEEGAGFNSQLFRYARLLLRGAAERRKPNDERLREFTDTMLPRLEQDLAAPVPIYPQLERLTLSFSLERMRERLGPDNSVVLAVLKTGSPDSVAAHFIAQSKLADPAVRMRLWKGGEAAIAASDDSMIKLAELVDPQARQVRREYDDRVEAPVLAASRRIARARFAIYGTTVYPDATFTLRLNFGTVEGWSEAGRKIEPFTTLSGLFARATGQEPFRIPQRWESLQSQLQPAMRVNLCTDNDIVGGNSGSPLIDARGRLVGLIFDGNIFSIAGAFWFDPARNRAVAVHPAIMRAALSKVYRAPELLHELEEAGAVAVPQSPGGSG